MITRIGKFATVAGAIASAAVLPSALMAQDDDVTVLEPTTSWNVSYDEDKCRLSREFGGKEGIVLLIDKAGPEPFYNVILVGDELRRLSRDTATLRFGPAEDFSTRSFVYGKSADGRRFVLFYGTPLAPPVKDEAEKVEAIGPEREAAIANLYIGHSETRGLVTLNTGSLGEPLAALRTCVDDLQDYLAIDTDSGETEPTPAGNPGNWVTDNDYPVVFSRRGTEGLLMVRLTVNAQGKPTSCQIVDSTTPQSFDDVVCMAFLNRAKFSPATDSEGNPRAAYWTGSVRFQMP